MDSLHRNKGQALIEVAVVLPLLCLAIVVTVQLIACCHNAILLQRLAFQTTRDMTAGMHTTPTWLTHNPLWGRGAAPVPQRSTFIPDPWRPFETLIAPCVTDPGHITTVTIKSLLLPSLGYGRILEPLTQSASAGAYLEPPVPQES